MRNLKDNRIEMRALDEMTEEYTTVATVWAHFRSLSVKEAFNAGADTAWENVYFTFMRPVDFELNTYCSILYNKNEYEIVAIDLFDDTPGDNIRVQARRRYW